MGIVSTELAIALVLLGPLALLAWALFRRARRIQEELLDKQRRTALIDDLSPGLVRYVIERDEHQCQTCGGRHHVGVDFRDDTPDDDYSEHLKPEILEARCARCFAERWPSLDRHAASE